MGVVALIFWGTWSVSKLPIDAVPDITNNQVQVVTYSPTLAPQEVEQLITHPIELALTNIPQLEEVRSISRFGLSVITIVFAEHTDIYWARQQIMERISQAVEQIPAGLGKPYLAPVSTGLSEIYQYILEVDPAYAKNYSLSELRTIQDWEVRRKLIGLQGVADVSSFGGFVKQYEISIYPDRLQSLGVTVAEIAKALQDNNENGGGAYITKGPDAIFIRSEGLIKDLSDIEGIGIKTTSAGIPIRISDVGKVRFGKATRFGALTNGANGETVGGIVLMLKGGNSREVCLRVEERMKEIEQTLPPGIKIKTYLNRSDLVDRAIATVRNNLIEGALIVIFVLVLLLGNLRAGIIVASVIPLSLLFAFGMMYTFGVSANLMSLGAIDFGLIVDGSIIIVEASLHHLGKLAPGTLLSRNELNDHIYKSASQIRTTAAFGEAIILVVYLPLLALSGIEGKMFHPMAQTVAFAIGGAFILSLTYVPMASSWLLSRKVKAEHSLADRVMEKLSFWYMGVLAKVLNFRKIIVGTAVILFALGLVVFSTLGGEFLPTIDEGDFAVEMRLLPGSSLEKTIASTQRAAQLLKENFPEVKQVIGKIGTSEIPTDPMPFEACDLMVVLKDKKEWRPEMTKNRLAEEMQQVLSQIPGVLFGFQQPIQMRFNELMTGARQDVVVRIYGDELPVLEKLSSQIGKLAEQTPGAKDVFVERLAGLPTLTVSPNREKLARFGLSVAEVNRLIQTAFGGAPVGKVFEGEKRFDLVVRMDSAFRQNMADLENLRIENPTGTRIPLTELCDVYVASAPNQLLRQNARRRTTVAFNLRGGDVATVIDQLKKKVQAELSLPAGYFLEYGGQFKNLEEATGRLSVTVPIALFLIALLLFSTFHSWGQAMLIFTAIPLSSIGGIAALWLRGMPFSISAAVGFIALFGVAVLNGIVLMSEFNRQYKLQPDDLTKAILSAAQVRLRPVLMTALVASLGFFPMATSTGGGAEVQKPLATVVIGGLFSATLLTLFVLPCLYSLYKTTFFNSKKMMVGVLLLFSLVPLAHGQEKKWRFGEFMDGVRKSHPAVLAAETRWKAQQEQIRTAFDPSKLQLNTQLGQYNSDYFDNYFSIQQTFASPAFYKRQQAYLKNLSLKAEIDWELMKIDYQLKASLAYGTWLRANQTLRQLQAMDSLFSQLERLSELRLRKGESSELETLLIKNLKNDVGLRLLAEKSAQEKSLIALQVFLPESTPAGFEEEAFETLLPEETTCTFSSAHPLLRRAELEAQLSRNTLSIEKSKLLPEWSIGYFNQSLNGISLSDGRLAGPQQRFQGIQSTLHIPIFAKANRARIKSADLIAKADSYELERMQRMLREWISKANTDYAQAQAEIAFFGSNIEPNLLQIKNLTSLLFKAGTSDYGTVLLALKQKMEQDLKLIELKHKKFEIQCQFQYLNNKK